MQQVGSKNANVGLLLNYYLFNQGGTLTQVAQQATGVNFDYMLSQLNSTTVNAVSVGAAGRALPLAHCSVVLRHVCPAILATLQLLLHMGLWLWGRHICNPCCLA